MYQTIRNRLLGSSQSGLWLLCVLLTMLFVLSVSAGQTAAAGDDHDHHSHDSHDTHDHADADKDEHAHEVKLTPDAIRQFGITIAPVGRQVLIPSFTAPARIAFNAEAMAHIGAVLRGRVVDLKVRRGDTVKKGDELFIVESPELGEAQSDFLQKRTAVEIATPAVQLAKNAFDRAKKLYDESRGIALTELQKRESDYRMAQGTLQAATSAATAAENKLHLLGMDQKAVERLIASGEITPRYPTTAPIAGTVIDREITLGELVSPEKEALLVLADMSTLWVIADVPEARLHQVAKGSRANVKVAAAGMREIAGVVSYIDSAVDPNTRSARVRIEIQGSAAGIRPGMFAQAEIFAPADKAQSAAVLAIPDEAVQTVEGGPAVFVPVPDEENTFTVQSITAGKAVGGMVPVLSGLEEGRLIVVKGSFILKAELGKGEAKHEH